MNQELLQMNPICVWVSDLVIWDQLYDSWFQQERSSDLFRVPDEHHVRSGTMKEMLMWWISVRPDKISSVVLLRELALSSVGILK